MGHPVVVIHSQGVLEQTHVILPEACLFASKASATERQCGPKHPDRSGCPRMGKALRDFSRFLVRARGVLDQKDRQLVAVDLDPLRPAEGGRRGLEAPRDPSSGISSSRQQAVAASAL